MNELNLVNKAHIVPILISFFLNKQNIEYC